MNKQLSIRKWASSLSLRKSERGTSFVEFTIAAPLLISFLFAVVDLGQVFSNYMVLTQIAREGVRMASGISGLEAGEPGFCGSLDTAYAIQVCPVLTGTPLPQPTGEQRNVWTRASRLLRVHSDNKDLSLVPGSVEITTSFQQGLGNDQDDTVSIELTARYSGIFPLFDEMPITVRARGPYLF